MRNSNGVVGAGTLPSLPDRVCRNTPGTSSYGLQLDVPCPKLAKALDDLLILPFELRIDFGQWPIIVLNVLKPLIYWPQKVVWTVATAPIVPQIFGSVGQTFTIKRTINVLNPFLADRLRQTSIHFFAPAFMGVRLR